ncbi:MAG: P-II family nitrogen regulator [Actinomycetota bacterium]|nr:P-II family nitrogen regulator [Actinomycetota bacterium]
MKKVAAVFRPERLGEVAAGLESQGFGGFTISDVRGHGQSPEKRGEWRGQTYELHVSHKLQIELIVEDSEVTKAVDAIVSGARTGKVGDGLVTVTDITAVYQIRTTPSATNGKAEIVREEGFVPNT